nr:IS1-like element transposase [Sansalvadorimonas verongulae]
MYNVNKPGAHERIVDMAINGSGVRDTGRVLGIMHIPAHPATESRTLNTLLPDFHCAVESCTPCSGYSPLLPLKTEHFQPCVIICTHMMNRVSAMEYFEIRDLRERCGDFTKVAEDGIIDNSGNTGAYPPTLGFRQQKWKYLKAWPGNVLKTAI